MRAKGTPGHHLWSNGPITMFLDEIKPAARLCRRSIKITVGKVMSIHSSLPITRGARLFLPDSHKSFGVRSR